MCHVDALLGPQFFIAITVLSVILLSLEYCYKYLVNFYITSKYFINNIRKFCHIHYSLNVA